jgi:hypothetical protein
MEEDYEMQVGDLEGGGNYLFRDTIPLFSGKTKENHRKS